MVKLKKNGFEYLVKVVAVMKWAEELKNQTISKKWWSLYYVNMVALGST